MGFAFAPGIYEALLSQKLSELLLRHPELRSVFGKVDQEEEPGRYSAFLAGVIHTGYCRRRQEIRNGMDGIAKS